MNIKKEQNAFLDTFYSVYKLIISVLRNLKSIQNLCKIQYLIRYFYLIFSRTH